MLMLRKVSKPADGRRGLNVSQQLRVCELGKYNRLSFQQHNILVCSGRLGLAIVPLCRWRPLAPSKFFDNNGNNFS